MKRTWGTVGALVLLAAAIGLVRGQGQGPTPPGQILIIGPKSQSPAQVVPPAAEPGVKQTRHEAPAPKPTAPATATKAAIDFSGAAPLDNPTGRQEPAVRLEWIGPTAVRLGQPANYQIVARNVSSTTVHQVIVRQRLGEDIELKATDPKAAPVDERVLLWELGTLQPAQEKRINVQMVAKKKGVMDCQAFVTFTGESRLRFQVREPKVHLKASIPSKVVLGDVATVALTVSNQGDGVAEQIKIKTVLAEGLEHARGKVVEIEVGSLGPKETRTVQLICAAKAEGPQKCEAVILADGQQSVPTTVIVDVLQPKLELAVAGPKMRYLERHAVYTYKVANAGTAPATTVTVTEQLPQGFKFHAASAGGHYDLVSRAVSWFVGDLPPGQSREVQLEVVAAGTGDHKHQAVARAARGLQTQAEIATHVEGLSAIQMELVDLDDPVEVGADTAYEIRVTNTGSKTETNVQLTCVLPEKMEFRGAKGAGGCRHKVEGREIQFEALPRLAPRADAIYRVNVRGVAPGDVRFRALIRADGLSEPVHREESTKVYGD
jgi:uncharacterized repeat protein (TIGR01451 family)